MALTDSITAVWLKETHSVRASEHQPALCLIESQLRFIWLIITSDGGFDAVNPADFIISKILRFDLNVMKYQSNLQWNAIITWIIDTNNMIMVILNILNWMTPLFPSPSSSLVFLYLTLFPPLPLGAFSGWMWKTPALPRWLITSSGRAQWKEVLLPHLQEFLIENAFSSPPLPPPPPPPLSLRLSSPTINWN